MEGKCFSALSHDNRKRTGLLTINKLTHTHKCSLSLAHRHVHACTQPHTFTHLLPPFPALLFSINLQSFIPLIVVSLHFLFTASSVPPFSTPLHLFSSSHLIYSFYSYLNLCFCSFIVCLLSSPLLSARIWCRHIYMDWDDCNFLRTLCVVKLNLLWADFLWHLKSVLFWGEPASFLAEWRPPPSDQSRV